MEIRVWLVSSERLGWFGRKRYKTQYYLGIYKPYYEIEKDLADFLIARQMRLEVCHWPQWRGPS
jgi:hypothetical protein